MTELQDPEFRFRLALQAARLGIWEYDLMTGIGRRSPELRALLGLHDTERTLVEMLGDVHEDDRDTVVAALTALADSAATEGQIHFRFRHPDGRLLWLEQHVFVERDPAGQARHFYSLVRDVTTQRQTEQELHDLNATLEARVADRTRELEEERAALDAFVAFTEVAGAQPEPHLLALHAVDALEHTLAEVSVLYMERDRDLWKVRAHSPSMDAGLLAQLESGVPVEPPGSARAMPEGDAFFLPDWHGPERGLPLAAGYRAAAVYPCVVDGRAAGLLVMGITRAPSWTPREQAVFRAVGRSLTLALERAAVTATLWQQNEALEARTRALGAANEELEAFAYSVSHDLRTPVRHVMGFVELTRTALRREQVDKALRSLDIVSEAAQRMNTLIDGMLELSRAGREGFTPRWVNLGGLIDQARQDVAREFPNRQVRWTVDADLDLWADPGLLQQVMTNLISNAVKYSSGQATSDLTVRAVPSETGWTVTVQDNGVGFDERYAHKLFAVFQRLHTPREFPGTGVGLATVRRIVLKHGGTVFAHSPGQAGAVFGFTLPRPVADDAESG